MKFFVLFLSFSIWLVESKYIDQNTEHMIKPNSKSKERKELKNVKGKDKKVEQKAKIFTPEVANKLNPLKKVPTEVIQNKSENPKNDSQKSNPNKIKNDVFNSVGFQRFLTLINRFSTTNSDHVEQLIEDDLNAISHKKTLMECKIRTRVIDIENTPGIYRYPSSKMVNECRGETDYFWLYRCVPDKQENVTYTFSEYNHILKTTRNKTETVLQPMSCTFRCRVTTCPANSIYDSNSCICSCQHKNESCSAGKQWFSDVCACMCSNSESCGPDEYWDNDLCKCKPKLLSGPSCMVD